ncbi:MAG: hypothetical protein ACEY3D_06695 [Rickettsia sp.]
MTLLCHSRVGGNLGQSEITSAFNFKNLLCIHLFITGFPPTRE